MMKFRVAEQFRGLSAVEFTREFLDLFDTTQLSEFKFRKSQVSGGRYKGIHGNCKPPGYPNWNATTFRISCSVSGTDEDFPKTKNLFPWDGAPKHAGTTRPEYVATSVNELLAWVAGHEIFHYLGQPTMVTMAGPDATGQIRANSRSEQGADVMGYEFLYAIREGRSPVEVADAITDTDPEKLVAPYRFPYTRER